MAIYYISTTGSDANSGAIDSPFATVTAANAIIAPGDTVYFRAGTYHNATYGDGNVWKDGFDVIMRINEVNGTADQPITYAAMPGEEVILKYDGNGAIRLQNSTHIRIEGFDIEGPNGEITLQEALDHQFLYRIDTNNNGTLTDEVDHARDPFATLTQTVSSEGGQRSTYFNSNAIAINSGSNHIEIINNKIHDSPGHAIASLGGADYVTVRGNEIYNNTWYSSYGNHAISFKGVVSSDALDVIKIIVDGNTLTDNRNMLISWANQKTAPVEMVIDEGKSIHVQLATAADGFTAGWFQISNNVILRSGNAGITVNGGDRVIIANNTIIDAGDINKYIAAGLADPKAVTVFTVAAGGFRLAGGEDIQVINNLIHISNPDLNVVDAVASVAPSNTTFAGNIYSGGTGLFLRGTPVNYTVLSQGFTSVANLGFQDLAAGNYRLLISSPAVDAGSNLLQATILTDFDGTQRASGLVDVGAFEADKTAPAVSSVTPLNNAAAFLVDSDLTFSFSEIIRRGSGTATLKTATGTVVETFNLATSTAVSLSGNKLVIDPTQDLTTSSKYVLELAQGAVLDEAGNAVAASGPVSFTAAPFNRYLNGTSAAESYTGSALHDFIYGGAGVDKLNGGSGSDHYYVARSAEHTSAEFYDTGASGTDRVRFAATTADTLTLFTGDTGIESVVFGTGTGLLPDATGTAALNLNAAAFQKSLTVSGNAGNNVLRSGLGPDRLIGNAGADTLSAGAGNDYLYGGVGHDILLGGTGSDRFVFNTPSPSTHSDTILDFTHGVDRIYLDNAVFKALGLSMTSSEFVQGRNFTQAKDKYDNIIYNTATGAVYYDADGLGGASSVKFAQLGTTTKHPISLSYSDFWVY
jgi:Ca2+-binding RTX toxin-like protein